MIKDENFLQKYIELHSDPRATKTLSVSEQEMGTQIECTIRNKAEFVVALTNSYFYTRFKKEAFFIAENHEIHQAGFRQAILGVYICILTYREAENIGYGRQLAEDKGRIILRWPETSANC